METYTLGSESAESFLKMCFNPRPEEKISHVKGPGQDS